MSDFISKLFSKAFIKEFTKFAIVGALGTLINVLVLYLFTEIFNVYYIISEIVAFIVSSINNYLLNKIWTFKEELQEKIVIKYTEFLTISVIALIINLSVLFVLVEYFNFWYILAEVGAIICAFLFNYVGNKLWTFRKRERDLTKSPSQVDATDIDEIK